MTPSDTVFSTDTRILDPFFPSKILVFGEYSVLSGSQALALPLPQFGGRWRVSAQLKKQYDLPQLAQYIYEKNLPIDTEALFLALKEGFYFDSDIPRGYGAGSSGALVAAIFECFGQIPSTDLATVKQCLGQIESYYHGASSGFDPLISFVKKPILMNGQGNMQVLAETLLPTWTETTVFLIDTKMPRKTEPLVHLFLEKMKNTAFENGVSETLAPLVNDGIAAYLQGQSALLVDIVHQISLFQYRFLQEMIPQKFRSLWLSGLSGSDFKLKLCGAGGGGFILGFCNHFEAAQKALNKQGFQALPLSI